MKSIILVLAAATLDALGTPTPGTTESKVGTSESPQGLTVIDATTGSHEFSEAAAAASVWACVYASPSAQKYGYGLGSSESSAKSAAQKKCGNSSCVSWTCAERGCVGIAFASDFVALSAAAGYGSRSSDESHAISKVKSVCQSYHKSCNKPGYQCSADAI